MLGFRALGVFRLGFRALGVFRLGFKALGLRAFRVLSFRGIRVAESMNQVLVLLDLQASV